MISSVSGNSSLLLLSLFGRSQSAQADPTASSTSGRSAPPPPPPPPPSSSSGMTSQSLFQALLDNAASQSQSSGDSSTSSSGSGSVDQLLQQLVSALDTDGDGKLSTDELKAGMTAQSAATSDTSAPPPPHHHHGGGDHDGGGVQQMLSNIMGNLDSNGDGSLSADELTQGLSQLASATGASDSADSLSSIAKGLVSDLDQNGDGQIDQTELGQAFGVSSTQSASSSGSDPDGDGDSDGGSSTVSGIESRKASQGPASLSEALFNLLANPTYTTGQASQRDAMSAELQASLMA